MDELTSVWLGEEEEETIPCGEAVWVEDGGTGKQFLCMLEEGHDGVHEAWGEMNVGNRLSWQLSWWEGEGIDDLIETVSVDLTEGVGL
jgi:hypothetical protein